MKLKEIFNLMEEPYVHGRKTPCDIVDFMDDEYFSESRDADVKYGDMDITHYIRSQLKNSNESYLSSELEKVEKENRKLKNIISDYINSSNVLSILLYLSLSIPSPNLPLNSSSSVKSISPNSFSCTSANPNAILVYGFSSVKYHVPIPVGLKSLTTTLCFFVSS